MLPDQNFRLTDAQMASFIAHGHITVTPDLPREFHAEVFAQHEEVFEKEGNPGNNLLPRIPLIRQIFEDPAVVGALQSVIGDDYYLQPHRHPHFNPPGSKGQNMHQDGGKRWSHRTRYLLALYYPQDTPVERGPSGIVPGSHYFNTPEGARTTQEVPLACPAGPVTIVNYDLWHRQMPNLTDHNRYMVKFLFARMCEPQTASWRNEQTDWPGAPAALEGDGEELQKMYEYVWRWHRGMDDSPSPTATNGHVPADLFAALASEQERVAIAAAYDLADCGDQVLPPLLRALADESEMTRRHAAYSLSAIGGPAVESLADLLPNANPATRSDTATILGDIGLAAASALPALIEAARDPHEQVRQHAVEALGLVCQSSSTAVPTLIEALADEHAPVRRSATFSLTRLGPHAEDAISALELVLDDENRYVRGDALHALERIGTPAAKDVLIRHLVPARWCPLTSPESTF